MSLLTVYPDSEPGTILLQTTDGDEIARNLQPLNVRFERWEAPVPVGEANSSEEILAAYKPYLDKLLAGTAGTADVIRLKPGNPAIPAMRAKFIEEHTHTEDEVRFFVAGSGNFIIHHEDKVYDVHCETNDLISVPAEAKHWFDSGHNPDFIVLRIFTDTTGWTPYYTGDKISANYPAQGLS
jgi:1,2-dihydroxy-3-keto-5-methylthiopentene dioxygenase